MIMAGKKKAVEALAEAKNAQQELASLSRQIRRQRLVTKALWKVLSDKLGLTEEQLAEALAQVEEAEPGSRRVAELCQQCGRSLQDGHTTCIYCGAPAKPRAEI